MSDFYRISYLKIFDNFFDFQDFSKNNKKILCVNPFIFERLILNSLFFILPFIFGLHIIHNKKFLKLEKINLNSFFKNFFTMHRNLRFLNFFFLVFILTNACYLFYIYISYSTNKFIFYVSFLIGLIIIISSAACYLRLRKQLSINLITFTFISIPLINLHCLYSQILLGLTCSIFTYEYSKINLDYKSIFEIFEDRPMCVSNQEINMNFITDRQPQNIELPKLIEINSISIK